MDQPNLLDQLTVLAREDSSERRRDLLHALTDLYLADGVSVDEQVSMLYGEIVAKVVDQVDVAAKTDLSRRLAPHAFAPRQAILKLANDDIAVASPILERSPVLTEQDLVQIASTKSDSHMMAISGREMLSEAVTDVLVDRGSQEVLRAVSNNSGARFSEGGFRTLAERSDGDELLQEILHARRDMPDAVRSELTALMSEELKDRLAGMGASISQEALSTLATEAVARLGRHSEETEGFRAQIYGHIEKVKRGEAHPDTLVFKICREDRALDLGWALAQLADLPDAGLSKAVLKSDPGPLAMVCKVLGVSTDAFEKIAEMRRKRLRLAQGTVVKEVRQYDALSMADAQRAFRFLKVRRSVATG